MEDERALEKDAAFQGDPIMGADLKSMTLDELIAHHKTMPPVTDREAKGQALAIALAEDASDWGTDEPEGRRQSPTMVVLSLLFLNPIRAIRVLGMMILLTRASWRARYFDHDAPPRSLRKAWLTAWLYEIERTSP